jgi:SAM-dependent methyltransferase
MLKRVLEPELMDTVEDAEKYHAMDFAEPDGRFAERALDLLAFAKAPEILDVGTGTAKIPVLLAQARTDLRVVAIDPAREMLRVAARHVADHRVDERVTLARVDGRASKLAAQRFDAVQLDRSPHARARSAPLGDGARAQARRCDPRARPRAPRFDGRRVGHREARGGGRFAQAAAALLRLALCGAHTGRGQGAVAERLDLAAGGDGLGPTLVVRAQLGTRLISRAFERDCALMRSPSCRTSR